MLRGPRRRAGRKREPCSAVEPPRQCRESSKFVCGLFEHRQPLVQLSQPPGRRRGEAAAAARAADMSVTIYNSKTSPRSPKGSVSPPHPRRPSARRAAPGSPILFCAETRCLACGAQLLELILTPATWGCDECGKAMPTGTTAFEHHDENYAICEGCFREEEQRLQVADAQVRPSVCLLFSPLLFADSALHPLGAGEGEGRARRGEAEGRGFDAGARPYSW